MFKNKDFAKWGLSPEDQDRIATIQMDKNLAFSCMLPKETDLLTEVENTYHFMTNQCLTETLALNKYNAETLAYHFKEQSYSYGDVLSQGNMTWTTFASNVTPGAAY